MPGAAVAFLDHQDPRCFTRAGFLALAARQWGWPERPADLADFADRLDAMKAPAAARSSAWTRSTR